MWQISLESYAGLEETEDLRCINPVKQGSELLRDCFGYLFWCNEKEHIM